jgi:hypothetical protein
MMTVGELPAAPVAHRACRAGRAAPDIKRTTLFVEGDMP